MKKIPYLIILLLIVLLLASTAVADTDGDDPIYVVMEPGQMLVFVCPDHQIKASPYDSPSSWFAKCADN